MIVRDLKLKLTKKQEAELDLWLWYLTGVYNFAIKKIGNDAKDHIYYSEFDFGNILAGHSKKLGVPSHIIQATLKQACNAWQRCFKKLGKRPRLKGERNKFNSIPLPDKIKAIVDNKISIPGIGKVRFHKQDIPEAVIKCGRIVKKASGWYICLWLDTTHKIPVKETDAVVGIDPGFSTLITLSDGTKFENPRELRKGAERYAQAQKGNRKKLSARLQERQANRRKDRNHKISRKLVENYQTIFYSDDNFKAMSKTFGKSISEASLGDLRDKLIYKGKICGRTVAPVNSRNTTKTCCVCGALTGPSGIDKLAVRQWQCSACGADHDRDINAARVIAKVGLGTSLKEAG